VAVGDLDGDDLVDVAIGDPAVFDPWPYIVGSVSVFPGSAPARRAPGAGVTPALLLGCGPGEGLVSRTTPTSDPPPTTPTSPSRPPTAWSGTVLPPELSIAAPL
jgi:hypothetical protein